MTDILVIAAHPHLEQSRVNRRLMAAAAGVERVELRDLYAIYPDYLIDVAAEQAALERAKLVVWLHPLHWYAMPSLMKLWVDEVLRWGWAYGPDANALRGKDLWLVASTGGAADSYRPDSYNRYHFDAFLPPYEQTATLCGLRFLPPMVLHGAHRLPEDELAADARLLAERLRDYPDWPELAELGACVDCRIPATARPENPMLEER
jgi:glutathione-regulated potassium-efflux system ancillary protein KefF